MHQINTVIIDDEESGREIIARLLESHFPKMRVAGEGHSLESAIEAIRTHRPHLVFLDVEMPTGTGIQVLEATQDLSFEVIFVTAYSQYALEAFRFSAVHYLLKPINPGEFVEAVRRAEGQIGMKGGARQIAGFLDQLRHGFRPLRNFRIPTSDGFFICAREDVQWCEGDGSYTYVHLSDGTKQTVCKPLKEIEQILDDPRFFRIHRSFLVNISSVMRYFRGKGGEVAMPDGTLLPVARNRKQEFLQWLEAE